MKFGEIKKIELKDIWNNEAYDFTPWLSENIDSLGEALGMELELTDMEADVGDFSLDLLIKDLGTGNTVVVENQLTQTDHDHLGKLLTYASGYSASTVVWISDVVRDEHRQALEWLNQRTDEETQFFGVEVEVFSIDESNPAFTFNPVVSPSEWQKSKKRQVKNTVSEKGELYRIYFQDLIDKLRENYRFTNARVGQPQNWYSFSSGITGISYGAAFVQSGHARTELYIDFEEADKNKALFDWLLDQKDKLQSDLGEELVWDRMDDNRYSRIAIYKKGTIYSSSEELIEIKQWQIENLIEFKKYFTPLLKKGLKSIEK